MSFTDLQSGFGHQSNVDFNKNDMAALGFWVNMSNPRDGLTSNCSCLKSVRCCNES